MAEPVNDQPRLPLSVDTYLRLVRIRDWVKNLAILLPLFFSLRIDETGQLARAFSPWPFFPSCQAPSTSSTT